MDQIATITSTVFVMLSGFALYLRFDRQRREIETLKAENEKLRSANRTHLPYNTAEEIEHLLAAVVLLKSDLEVKATLVENIEAHAKMARENRRAGAAVNT